MKKNILLIIFLVFLMVMNGVLLFLVIKKPSQRQRPPREFISEQLNFNETQTASFLEFDREHHRRMREINFELNDLKQMLFSELGNSSLGDEQLDSITEEIGTLTKAREIEVFRYFSEVEKICNDKQKQKLKRIVSGALRHGPPGDRPPGGPPPR
ncbi:Spy/CpxP family protein refolding chaperone [Flagellimonas sp. S174]|uniref:Spy/CpxP family protein refolding chaperone n=1 Tax=Flagellimonas sp. S174 TaxID=3410790 RepID=UPI003BF51602